MKRLLIRWAIRQLKKKIKANPNISYDELASYGIADFTMTVIGEKAYIFD